MRFLVGAGTLGSKNKCCFWNPKSKIRSDRFELVLSDSIVCNSGPYADMPSVYIEMDLEMEQRLSSRPDAIPLCSLYRVLVFSAGAERSHLLCDGWGVCWSVMLVLIRKMTAAQGHRLTLCVRDRCPVRRVHDASHLLRCVLQVVPDASEGRGVGVSEEGPLQAGPAV